MAESKPLAQRQDASVFQMIRTDEMTQRVTALLPEGQRPDHFIAQIVSVIKQSPALMECEPVSLLQCTVRAAMHGLPPDPVLQFSHFIPRFNKKLGCNEATFQVGYRGMKDLAERSGKVKTIRAFMVHENDEIEVRLGTNPDIIHRPKIDGDRGTEIACYAVAHMADGSKEFEVMGIEELDKFQAQYAATDSDYGPWKTATNEMRKKTVTRRLAKQLPLSSRDMRLIIADEYREAGVDDGLKEYDIDVTPDAKKTAPDRQPGETSAQAKIRAAAAEAAKPTAERITPTSKGDIIDTVPDANAPAQDSAPATAAPAGTGPRRGRKAAQEPAAAKAEPAKPAEEGYTGAKITQAQIETLTREVNERTAAGEITPADWQRFKEDQLGVKAAADIPANEFDNALHWLRTGEVKV